jgi:hypothetical protein
MSNLSILVSVGTSEHTPSIHTGWLKAVTAAFVFRDVGYQLSDRREVTETIAR